MKFGTFLALLSKNVPPWTNRWASAHVAVRLATDDRSRIARLP